MCFKRLYHGQFRRCDKRTGKRTVGAGERSGKLQSTASVEIRQAHRAMPCIAAP